MWHVTKNSLTISQIPWLFPDFSRFTKFPDNSRFSRFVGTLSIYRCRQYLSVLFPIILKVPERTRVGRRRKTPTTRCDWMTGDGRTTSTRRERNFYQPRIAGSSPLAAMFWLVGRLSSYRLASVGGDRTRDARIRKRPAAIFSKYRRCRYTARWIVMSWEIFSHSIARWPIVN